MITDSTHKCYAFVDFSNADRWKIEESIGRYPAPVLAVSFSIIAALLAYKLHIHRFDISQNTL